MSQSGIPTAIVREQTALDRRERKRKRQRERRRAKRQRLEEARAVYSSGESDVEDCTTAAAYTCNNDAPPPDHVLAEMEGTEYRGEEEEEEEDNGDRAAAPQDSSGEGDSGEEGPEHGDGHGDAGRNEDDAQHSSLREYQASALLTPEEELATRVVAVKAQSYVSDAAIEKLWQLCTSRAKTMHRLVTVGRLPKTYRKGIRAMAMKGLPRARCTAVVEDKVENGTVRKKFRFGQELPAALLQLPPDSPRTLLRTEAAVLLSDIKKYHIWVHRKLGFSDEAIAQQLHECDVSIDGVMDTKKGKRTFIAVSVRISHCLYLWRVYHPLKGVPRSKPNLHQLLR